MSGIHVVLIGGRAGSGKSTIGSELSRLTGYSLYDKDTIANPLSEELLVALSSHRADRESSTYLDRVRSFEYQSMRSLVLENVALGHSAIMVAPFGPEFRSAEWLKGFQADCDTAAGRPVQMHAVHLSVADDVLKARLERRGLPRDIDKLGQWETFVNAQASAPDDAVFTMDVSDREPREYAEHLIGRFSLTSSKPVQETQLAETHPERKVPTDGTLVGEFDVHLKGGHLDCTLPARFFQNYQKRQSVWGEAISTSLNFLPESQVEISATGRLLPFTAVLNGFSGRQKDGVLSFVVPFVPLREPLDSAPVNDLTEVTFALLDSPVTGDRVRPENAKAITLPCGQFDISVTGPISRHLEIRKAVGFAPHMLNNSGILRERNGLSFSSTLATEVLNTLHDALSFASGNWAGITLVLGTSASLGSPDWFQWGTTKMTDGNSHVGWYDPGHPDWLQKICDGILIAKSHEETWEPIRTALYWYVRSNTRGVGIDSSLILSQCALELLSWFVIVKKTAAMTEQGYGQLGNAADKLRLALTLLKIPWTLPKGLTTLSGFNKDWKDIADAIVQSRNYLVHPTQSRTGKRRAKQDYPWHELWVAAQWVLELIILRLLDYNGNYRNRTKLRDFDRVERVPWE